MHSYGFDMKIALTDERISEKCERGLMLRGFRVLKMPRYPAISAPMAAHPDMVMFTQKKRIITTADYCEIADFTFFELSSMVGGISFTVTADRPTRDYPDDCIFNALVIGDKIFLKTDTVSRAVTEYARREELKPVNVKQGYPACTVLPIGEHAAITADRGMAEAMRAEGISVTLIEDGGIILPPYEYGFIGGASGCFGSTIYFLGDIHTHPSADRIIRAAEAAGFNCESLSDEPLSDLGGIVFYEG